STVNCSQKHLHFQMNLFLPCWALAAKRQPHKVSECAAERTPNIFFTKLIGRRCLRRFFARLLQTLFLTHSSLTRESTPLNPVPPGEDAKTSANLAMSDHLFRAKFHAPGRMDPLTSGLELSASSLICLI